MPIVVYGHYGQPLLMFPTAAADCEEYERFGLISAIAHHIDSGRVKVFSIDSINRESWLNDHAHPAHKTWRQHVYDRYVDQEVAPFIAEHCRTPGIGIATTGASFGAYHAANTVFKHPDKFKTVIAMSGSYDLRAYCSNYYDDFFYFNNPVDYLPNLNDAYVLDQLRSCRIIILTGQGAYEAPQRSQQLSELLSRKGIPHQLDLWGHDVNHDWPWWKIMLNVYIEKLF
ncbi:MAG: esterase family protein [Acidobacteria bacterium]|nr:esterase family protein [Acidobacteriota bacterium]MBI3654905.1 esterase family protein [Acidobacteriota bacterium]